MIVTPTQNHQINRSCEHSSLNYSKFLKKKSLFQNLKLHFFFLVDFDSQRRQLHFYLVDCRLHFSSRPS